MPYVPDPTDVTQPTDAVIAETAAAEFRALKAYIQANLGGDIPGQAKAWVVFDGTLPVGPIAPIKAFNVVVIAKVGTGDYTIFFNAGVFADGNYTMSGSVRTNSGTGQHGPSINNAAAPTNLQCRILCANVGVVADSDRISVIFFDHL